MTTTAVMRKTHWYGMTKYHQIVKIGPLTMKSLRVASWLVFINPCGVPEYAKEKLS